MWVPFRVWPTDYVALCGSPVGWYLRRGTELDMRKTFKTHRQAWAVCRRLNQQEVES